MRSRRTVDRCVFERSVNAAFAYFRFAAVHRYRQAGSRSRILYVNSLLSSWTRNVWHAHGAAERHEVIPCGKMRSKFGMKIFPAELIFREVQVHKFCSASGCTDIHLSMYIGVLSFHNVSPSRIPSFHLSNSNISFFQNLSGFSAWSFSMIFYVDQIPLKSEQSFLPNRYICICLITDWVWANHW